MLYLAFISGFAFISHFPWCTIVQVGGTSFQPFKIDLTQRKPIILHCPSSKYDPPCRLWSLKEPGSSQADLHLINVLGNGDTIWHSEELKCRIRRPSTKNVKSYDIELIGWEYDWQGFFDDATITCGVCAGDCDRQCIKDGRHHVLGSYKLQVNAGKPALKYSTGCDNVECTPASFVNVTYSVCEDRNYCRHQLDGIEFTQCTRCDMKEQAGNWSLWTSYTPTNCRAFHHYCQSGFRCRYRICNSPYPTASQYCPGDEKRTHFQKEITPCLGDPVCTEKLPGQSYIMITVVVTCLVVVGVALVVGSMSEELSEEEKQMRALELKDHMK